ncbi:MAG: putative glycoside hydrolase, partial [Dehalococcoidia bacterium]
MRRLLLPAIAVGVLAFSLLQAGSRADAFPTAVSLGSETEISRPASVRASTNIVRLGKPLRGVVLAWNGERGIRVPGAHIGTGEHTLDADDWGRFFIPASIRTNQLNIVAAGYEIVRKQTTADYIVIYLRPLDARAIYIPYDQLRRQLVLDWALDLARQGNVSAMVIDVKNEDGGVLPLVANQTARDFDFVRGTGTDLRAFFNELGELGIYRIARVVTFLDSRLATASPSDAILTSDGRIFRDPLGLAWTNPFRELPRKHNIEIGVNAAKFFDEVQYDYVRLPTQSGVALRSRTTSDERSGAIANFAKEAAEALHAVGAAL